MAQQDIRIPDIGDADDVEVVEILVTVGANVVVGDPLIVIESDKASMEVPTTAAGTIEQITVAVGDKVREGQVIAIVESDGSAEPANRAIPQTPPPANASVAADATKAPPVVTTVSTSALRRFEVRVPDIGDAKDVVVVEVAVKLGQMVSVDDLLVVVESDKASMEIPSPVAGRIASIEVTAGSAVSEGTLVVVVESAGESAGQPLSTAMAEAKAMESVVVPRSPEKLSGRPATAAASIASATPSQSEKDRVPPAAPPSGIVYAGPAVRRLARELGVDLTKLAGTGARGRILRDDVNAFVKVALSAPRGAVAGGAIPPIPVVDFARFGVVETVDLSRIRIRGAENLHRSWLNVPHVTQHDEADITDLELFRGELKAEAQAKNIKLTPLAFIVKAVVATLRTFPTFNASLDPSVRQLIVKRYYHIGLAVDTPDGLVVPVLRDADQRGIFELAKEIESLSQRAQQGKLSMSDLQGGSFSISSLGAIGGTGFTPIINTPEVAILGVSRLTMKPVWNGKDFEPRRMLPLSLSYDHRAINGAEAGRFVTSLCQTLADMRRLLL